MNSDTKNGELGGPSVQSADVQTDFYKALGQRLKEIREARGFKTAAAFGKALGVDGDTVGAWEAGTRRPNAYRLWQISDELGFPVDYMLDGKRYRLSKDLRDLLPPEPE